jgi:hypothetical protein
MFLAQRDDRQATAQRSSERSSRPLPSSSAAGRSTSHLRRVK